MSTSSTRIIAGAVVLALGALGLLYVYFYLDTSGGGDTSPVIQAIQAGDYEQALAHAESELMKNADGDAAAITRIEASMLPYAVSGDIQDALDAVWGLIAIAKDESLALSTRSAAIMSIQGVYSQTNSDQQIFDAVFSQPAFGESRIESENGEPLLKASFIRLYKYAHKLSPSSLSASQVAADSVSDARNRFGMPSETRALRFSDAQQYLEDAEALHAISVGSPEYRKSYSHTRYLVNRAYTLAALALSEEIENREAYKSAYQEALMHIKQSQIAFNIDHIPFVLYEYATFLLLIDQDESAASLVLDELLVHLNTRTRPSAFPAVLAATSPIGNSMAEKRIRVAMNTHEGFRAYVENVKGAGTSN